MAKTILLSAGGTGGHLVPAMDLAKKLEEKGFSVVFAAKGLSANRIFNKSYPYFDISGSPLKKSLSFFSSVFSLFKGSVQSFFICRKIKPDIVIGFGSFHTFPLLLAAKIKKIPLYLFEPNCIMGRVNRFFFQDAKKVFTLFLDSHEKTVPTSLLPWREIERISKKEARISLGLDPERPVILISGGSQGSQCINRTFYETAKILKEKNVVFQVIHLTGTKNEAEKAERYYKKLSIPFYVKAFETRMNTVFSASTFMIGRSGASTLSELISFKLPGIFIPYPYARDDHQKINAQFFFETISGGLFLEESRLSSALLFEKIFHEMLNEKKLKIFTDSLEMYRRKAKKRVSLEKFL